MRHRGRRDDGLSAPRMQLYGCRLRMGSMIFCASHIMAGDEPSRRENKMTDAERESLLKNLAESRERLLRMAQGLSREQLHYRLAPGRWTVAECVEHITTV